MNDQDFEGTLVLEKLAGIGKVDDFYDAIDADDFARAATLMRRAGIDQETIDIVLQKMANAEGEL